MRNRHKARILAFQALYAWELHGRNTDIIADLALFPWDDDKSLNAAGIIFSRHMFLSSIEHLAEIDALIDKYLNNWDISRLFKVDLSILRLSTHNLLFLEDIDNNIDIQEAIILASTYGGLESYRLINGILDRISLSTGRKCVTK